MIVTRWQAAIVPSVEQLKIILQAEGLESYEEKYGEHMKVPEHRHPFDEIRMVVKGQLMINVSGNRLLLRPGDRIEIPSNTRHSTEVDGQLECMCICANRAPL